jgi:phosphoglycolate phosphatase-like HAD superfamily hydrolase
VTRVRAGEVVFEVDGVAFDKDGTLIDLDAAWAPAARRWIEVAAAGDPRLATELEEALGFDPASGRLVVGGLFAVGTVRQLYETTLAVLESGGADPDTSRLVAGDARSMSAVAGEAGNLKGLGDVAGTMRALAGAGVSLAIVSSDDRSAIDAAITALGLEGLLATVVSGDEGFAPKPAPDSLAEAVRRLGLAPARVLYVGDSEVDAAAGRAAGLAGVVLVGDPPPGARALATTVVATVGDLTAV